MAAPPGGSFGTFTNWTDWFNQTGKTPQESGFNDPRWQWDATKKTLVQSPAFFQQPAIQQSIQSAVQSANQQYQQLYPSNTPQTSTPTGTPTNQPTTTTPGNTQPYQYPSATGTGGSTVPSSVQNFSTDWFNNYLQSMGYGGSSPAGGTGQYASIGFNQPQGGQPDWLTHYLQSIGQQ